MDTSQINELLEAQLPFLNDLIAVSNYCLVLEAIAEGLPAEMFPDRPWGPGNNPKTAVWEYVKTHPEFEIDKTIQNKLLITVAPDGWLKKIR